MSLLVVLLLLLIHAVTAIVVVWVIVCEFTLWIFIFFAIVLIDCWWFAFIIFSIVITASFVIKLARHGLLAKCCNLWLWSPMHWLLQSVSIRSIYLLSWLSFIWIVAHHVVRAALLSKLTGFLAWAQSWISLTLVSGLSERVSHILLVRILVPFVDDNWTWLVRHVVSSHIGLRNSTKSTCFKLFLRLIWPLGRPSHLVLRVSTNLVMRAIKSRILVIHDNLIIALVITSVLCLISVHALLKKLTWS